VRLSEKTLELSICSQLAAALGRRVVWFGLTQQQEARAGFDACTRLGAQLLVLQFKASTTLRDGGKTRRFSAPHQQMMALRALARRPRGIFYALPNLGTTRELSKNSELLTQTWLLDVALLPALGPPTKRSGGIRRGGEHYLDLAPPVVTIWSDPQKLRLTTLAAIAAEFRLGGAPPAEAPGLATLFDEAHGGRWPFTRKSLALAILPEGAQPDYVEVLDE
jgi:hypothetical protein